MSDKEAYPADLLTHAPFVVRGLTTLEMVQVMVASTLVMMPLGLLFGILGGSWPLGLAGGLVGAAVLGVSLPFAIGVIRRGKPRGYFGQAVLVAAERVGRMFGVRIPGITPRCARYSLGRTLRTSEHER